MGDLVFVGVVVAFFVLMVGLVGLCDRVIGSDDESDLVIGADTTSDEAVAA